MADAGTLIGTDFGHALRREREERSRSLDWLSAETKVGLTHLEALEEGQFHKLPGGVFRRGIVRAYLQAIGLDEENWMPLFTASLARHMQTHGDDPEMEKADWATFADNVRRNRKTERRTHDLRWLGVISLLLSVAAIAGLLWFFHLRPLLQGKP